DVDLHRWLPLSALTSPSMLRLVTADVNGQRPNVQRRAKGSCGGAAAARVGQSAWMSPDLSWTLSPGVLLAVAIAGWAYVRRWRQVRLGSSRRRAVDAPVWRLCCFLASLLAALVALISPLDALADQLFFMHMVQHMLLLDLV